MIRGQQGLTLVELLVAIAVFAIIGAAAYSGLITVLEAREHSDRRADRLAAVQEAVGALEADIRQALPRAVRSDLRGRGHAMTDAEDRRDLLLLSRGGWPNPAELDRGTVARVNWRFEDDRLIRVWWTRPDAAPGTSETRRIMLEEVDDADVRFLDGNGDWQERWPGLGETDTVDTLPRAVEVSLDLADWGRIVRLFELPAGARGADGESGDDSGDGDGAQGGGD